MLLIAGIGAFFLLLHLVTAWRYAALMPERMVTHWGVTRDERGRTGFGAGMPRRWALSMGPAVSVCLSLLSAGLGTKPGMYIMPMVIQLPLYPIFLGVYVLNAKLKKENPGGRPL